MSKITVDIIGGGLAGCEAAWQLAQRGIHVDLYEMKPDRFSPAHTNENLCELVCSNSFRADGITNAVGLLKEEMRRLGSLVMQCADANRVPAGGALGVAREEFSLDVTKRISEHKNITVIRGEVAEIPGDRPVIIATGPLTSEALIEDINKITGGENLHFFDAAAPIVTLPSIDSEKTFRASRYDKGDADYINCPMDRREYELFYQELINAKTAPLRGFEGTKVFEGCMPVEVMARRGIDTLRFGPLKPVGLTDKRTGIKPYAVVQLRQDDAAGGLYNMVGFQTNLKWGEQRRVFSLIPGLERAEFVRYGVMHRNTFINSSRLLNNLYQLKSNENIFFAGQITGVEGYAESASSGLLAGLYLSKIVFGEPFTPFDNSTAIGALASYVSCEDIKNFQPMNINFGIIAPPEYKIKDKRTKYETIAARALRRIGGTDL